MIFKDDHNQGQKISKNKIESVYYEVSLWFAGKALCKIYNCSNDNAKVVFSFV